jgi:hypothetical protein
MTRSDAATPRRASRLGLYGPFAALAIALAAWSGVWWWFKGEVGRRLEDLAQHRRAAGGGLAWRALSVHGYPFRFDVDLEGVSWREPTGWGLTAPSLKAESSVFAPGHWVAYAPDGLVLDRPTGGQVRITGKAIRASVSQLDQRPPTVSLEAVGLRFAAVPGAAGYFLQAASELHLHWRAGPGDQGAWYVELDRAAPAPGSPLAALAGGRQATLVADAIFDHAGSLSGPSWASAVSGWSAAGARMSLRRLRLDAGESVLEGRGEGLTVGPDGRLVGSIDARMVHGDLALTRLAQARAVDPAAARLAAAVLQAGSRRAVLTMQAGQLTLGPVALAAAPKVY